MLVLRRFFLAGSFLALCLAACDAEEPLAPPPDAAVVGGVKPPAAASARPTSSSAVLVTWTDNAVNEDGFRVERASTAGGPWAVAGTTSANSTSFEEGQRASEQQVCYRVVAIRRHNESSPSNASCTTPPAAPAGLTVTRVDDQTVDLAWTDQSAAEDGYEVQRATAEGGPYSNVADLAANAVGYRDAGLSLGAYWYRVRAKNDGGFGDFSNRAFVSDPRAPLAPSGTNATPQSSTWIRITWVDNATNESGARVQRSQDGGSTWTTVRTIYGTNAASSDDSPVTSDRELCYRVLAFNAYGDSPPSNTDCTIAPLAPSALSTTVIDYQTVDLAWMDNSAVEDGYEVQRAPQGGNWATVADLVPNSTSYRDVAPTNATYWYKVRAKKDGGYSHFSNSVQVTLASEPPAAPSIGNASPSSSTHVFTSWIDNSTNEEGFRIERGPAATGPWEEAGATGLSVTWFLDPGRTSEQQVCYRVVAFNAVGESQPSDADCTAPPAVPTNLTATFVDGNVELTWSDNSSVEDGYQVSRLFTYCDPYGYGCYEYWEVIATLEPNATSYSDMAVLEFTTYFVVALKDGGSSDQSNYAYPTVP